MNIDCKHVLALAAPLFFACAPALAADPDFSGKWSVSGQIVGGNLMTIVSPVCTFQQNGSQLTGTCTGPNGTGSAVGLVNGAGVTFEWQMIPTDSIGLSGVSSFNGKLGPDNVVRGSWTFSGRPGASGQFTAQRT
jgi:hypothetical protein